MELDKLIEFWNSVSNMASELKGEPMPLQVLDLGEIIIEVKNYDATITKYDIKSLGHSFNGKDILVDLLSQHLSLSDYKEYVNINTTRNNIYWGLLVS